MKRNRLAVSFIFFMIGIVYGNLEARLPEVQTMYGFSNSLLGSVLLCNAAGAITAMPFAGMTVKRFGSKKLILVLAILLCTVFTCIPLLKSLWLIVIAFFLVGISSGTMDVAINGQAVIVERLYNKSIMSSFHAVFSGAMLMGAGTGSLFAKLGTTLWVNFIIIGLLGIILSVWAYFNMINDKEPQFASETPTDETEESVKFQLPTKAVLPLGIIAFCGMTGEGSIANWSANYLNKIVGQSESFAALGVAAFAGAMFFGRLIGDFIIREFGRRQVLIVSCIISIIGLALTLSVVNAWVALGGFFLVGLALSNVVPIIYSTAGNTEGVTPSVGIAMATTVGYAGFFVGPPVIGYLSDIFDLRIGLLFTLFLFVMMYLLVNRFIKT